MTIPSVVIFDVDGTLVDSVDLHASAWKDAFEEFGYKLPFATVRSQIGKGGDQILPVFLTEDEIDRIGQRLESRRSEIFKQRYLSSVKGFKNVRPLFDRLLADGKTIALGSSAKADELKHYKRLVEIGDLQLAAAAADNVYHSKPYPDIFQSALEQIGANPKKSIVVGDTPYDAEAAARAGIRAIGMLCGGWSETELRQAGCISVYADPSDLLARYHRSPFVNEMH